MGRKPSFPYNRVRESITARSHWEGECLVFHGTKSNTIGISTPWGRIYKRVQAAMWEAEHDMEVPEGMMAYRTCGNTRCVRPEHIRVGTGRQERAARRKRQEANRPNLKNRGDANANGRLTEEDVRAIRRSDQPRWALASDYGVHISTIGLIINRKRWQWLED